MQKQNQLKTTLRYFKRHPKSILGIAAILIITIGVVITTSLVQQNQDVRSEAASNLSDSVLDSRFGLVHACGVYPSRNAQGDYLQYTARQALSLGFRSIELIMIPRSLCSSDNLHPNGCYSQANQYCSDDRLNVVDMKGMFELPQFKEVMQMPFENITLYVEPVKTQSIKQASIHSRKDSYAPGEIQSTYNEAKAAARYLLTEFKNTGKTFYLSPINELDNRLVQSSGCLAGGGITACNDVEVPSYSVAHAINLLNTYARAVRDAKTEVSEQGVKVYLACEANRVLSRSMRGKTSAVNDVFPNVSCDLYTYSAYESFNRSGSDADLAQENMRKALDYIAQKTPDHGDFPQGKNIAISEIGYPDIICDGAYPCNTNPYRPVAITTFQAAIKEALDWGVAKINFFTLYDQKCVNTGSGEYKNGDCIGFGMIRPDGTNSTTYSFVQTLSNQAPVAPNIPALNTKFVSQNVPTEMKAGQDYPVELVFANTGLESWHSPSSWLDTGGFYLVDKANKSTDKVWGKGLFNITKGEVVKSGQWYNFKIVVKAPNQPGSYPFSWSLWEKGLGAFGEASALVNVQVYP